MITHTKLVDNGLEAIYEVRMLRDQGFTGSDIFILAHGDDRTERLADVSRANTIGTSEEGVLQTIANLFRTRGEELRGKLEAIGFERSQADYYEAQLDRGKVLVMARS